MTEPDRRDEDARARTAANGPTAPAPRRDAVAVALLCLALYVALHPSGFYGGDSINLYMMLGLGVTRGTVHELYLPLAAAMCEILEPLGGSRFLAMWLLSAIGVAGAVLVFHRAAALQGLDRKSAATAALAIGFAPAAVQFATEIEVSGPALFGASLAWWTVAWFLRRPSAPRALAIGLATGLAASMHSAAHVVTVALAVFALGERPDLLARWRRFPVWAVAASCGHVAVWLASTHLFGAPDAPSDSGAFEYLGRRFGILAHLEILPGIAWRELLLPWFPLWCAVVAGFVVRACRRRATAAALILIGYLGLCWMLLGPELLAAGVRLQEQGAYFLPVGFVFALLAVRVVHSWGRIALLGILLANALWLRHPGTDDVPPDAPAVPDVVALLDHRPGVLVVADTATSEAILIAAPDARILLLDTIRGWSSGREDWASQFDRMWSTLHGDGADIWFSDRAMRSLSERDDPLLSHLRAAYRLVREEHGTFAAWRVEPRER